MGLAEAHWSRDARSAPENAEVTDPTIRCFSISAASLLTASLADCAKAPNQPAGELEQAILLFQCPECTEIGDREGEVVISIIADPHVVPPILEAQTDRKSTR